MIDYEKAGIGEILNYITDIKLQRKKVFTNYFNNITEPETKYDILRSNASVVFLYNDCEVVRCYYCSNNIDDLTELLKQVPAGTVLDILSKKDEEEHEWIIKADFFAYKKYIRKGKRIDISNENEENLDSRIQLLLSLYDPQCGRYAVEEDLDELHNLLYKSFDVKCDHLPSKQELKTMIANRWVMVYISENRIRACYLYKIEGKKLYSNVTYNELTADITYSIERRAQEDAAGRYDINYFYAWFDASNSKALRRIRGLKDDGAYDYIYIKQ